MPPAPQPRRPRQIEAIHPLTLPQGLRKLPPMFLQFFTALRAAEVPVTLREYLTLMEALDADLAGYSVEDFYYLSRAALVKD